MGVKVRMLDGSWYVFINHKNKRKAKKIGTGAEAKKRAEEAARLIEARLAMGDLGILAQSDPVTLNEYAETWLENYVALNLKGGTHRIYAGIMKNHWLPALGDKPLAEITRADIRQVITDKMKGVLGRAATEGLITALQSCLSIAEEEGLLPQNPLRNSSKWLLKMTKHKIDASKVDIFTPNQLKWVLGWFAKEHPQWYALAMVMARTGMRLGEAAALKVRDLNFEDRKIHVERTWNSTRKAGGKIFNSPKGGTDRWVDMSLQLKDTLQAHLEHYPTEQGWVFYHQDGLPIYPYAFYRIWGKFFKSADAQLIPYRRPHVLRHTFASLLISRGNSLAYVRDVLGHRSIRVTVDLYTHFVRSESVRAVDSLDDPAEDSKSRKSYASEGIVQLKVFRGGQS